MESIMESSTMSEIMECPICFDIPSPPIYQCSNGHIFCSNCITSITKCGLCRVQLPQNPIRALMVEKLVETITQLQISKPVETQPRLTNYCDLLGLKDILNCGEKIPKDTIVPHMKKHGLCGVNGHMADVVQELNDFINPHGWFPVYFEAYGEVFFLLCSTENVFKHECSMVVSWRCVMVGDSVAAENFCLQLCLTNSAKGLKNVFNCPISDIENCINSDGSQLSLPCSQLKQFGEWNGVDKLKWSINVQIRKKSEEANAFQELESSAVPQVKTRPYAIKTPKEPSTSLLHSFGGGASVLGTKKVFFDLAINHKPIGRIVIELRYDVVPMTAENFRCLCTGEKGYGYKGSIFYKVNLQQQVLCGGDITKNNGRGGKSIYGRPFKDENFLLKHNERGILSMNNMGKDTNTSLFVITLKERSNLDGACVVFGKIVEGMKVLNNLQMFLSYPFVGKIVQIRNCGQL